MSALASGMSALLGHEYHYYLKPLAMSCLDQEIFRPTIDPLGFEDYFKNTIPPEVNTVCSNTKPLLFHMVDLVVTSQTCFLNPFFYPHFEQPLSLIESSISSFLPKYNHPFTLNKKLLPALKNLIHTLMDLSIAWDTALPPFLTEEIQTNLQHASLNYDIPLLHQTISKIIASISTYSYPPIQKNSPPVTQYQMLILDKVRKALLLFDAIFSPLASNTTIPNDILLFTSSQSSLSPFPDLFSPVQLALHYNPSSLPCHDPIFASTASTVELFRVLSSFLYVHGFITMIKEHSLFLPLLSQYAENNARLRLLMHKQDIPAIYEVLNKYPHASIISNLQQTHARISSFYSNLQKPLHSLINSYHPFLISSLWTKAQRLFSIYDTKEEYQLRELSILQSLTKRPGFRASRLFHSVVPLSFQWNTSTLSVIRDILTFQRDQKLLFHPFSVSYLDRVREKSYEMYNRSPPLQTHLQPDTLHMPPLTAKNTIFEWGEEGAPYEKPFISDINHETEDEESKNRKPLEKADAVQQGDDLLSEESLIQTEIAQEGKKMALRPKEKPLDLAGILLSYLMVDNLEERLRGDLELLQKLSMGDALDLPMLEKATESFIKNADVAPLLNYLIRVLRKGYYVSDEVLLKPPVYRSYVLLKLSEPMERFALILPLFRLFTIRGYSERIVIFNLLWTQILAIFPK